LEPVVGAIPTRREQRDATSDEEQCGGEECGDQSAPAGTSPRRSRSGRQRCRHAGRLEQRLEALAHLACALGTVSRILGEHLNHQRVERGRDAGRHPAGRAGRGAHVLLQHGCGHIARERRRAGQHRAEQAAK